MKVLMTGATGLIGKELGKHLVEQGHTIVALTRNELRARQNLPYPAEIVEWDWRDPILSKAAEKGLQDVDVVVNLMGENLFARRWSDSFKRELAESRVDSTLELISTLIPIVKPKAWIQASAIGFYGASKSGEGFTELSPKGDDFLADLCEQWEETLEQLPTDVRRVVIRTGAVFSHKGGAFQKMATPFLNDFGGRIGSGAQQMSIIHLVDVARFLAEAIEDGTANGVFNLVCDETISQKELSEKVAERMHVKQGPAIPPLAIKVALGEMGGVILNSQEVKNTRFSDVDFQLKYPSVDSILKEVCSWYDHPFGEKHAVFSLYAEQFIPKPVEEVFPFFSNAGNLEKLTPSFLGFEILSPVKSKIERNTEIEYRVRLHGVPIHWVSDILVWEPPTLFVDHQKKGPYSLWHHEHRFKPVTGGTLIVDHVRFKLPAGIFGKWIGYPKVKSDLDKIFSYRREILEKVFRENRKQASRSRRAQSQSREMHP